MAACYLVTGGAGFIGSHVVETLVLEGHEVRVVDNFSTGGERNLAAVRPEPDVIHADVRDVERLVRAARGVAGIFHLAALGSVQRSLENPAATFSANVDGTKAVLAAARAAGVRRVVCASSSSVYGANSAELRREGDAPSPLSPYAESKLRAEQACLAASAEGSPEVACLRYFNVYGPRQDPSSEYAAAIPRFITSCLRGARPVIYGDGEQARDFTYVADIAAGTLAAMAVEEAAGYVVNLGAGGRTSVNQLVALIRRLVGSAVEPDYAPPRPGDVRHSVADVTLAGGLLGYRPRWPLARGLGSTIAWLHAHEGGAYAAEAAVLSHAPAEGV